LKQFLHKLPKPPAIKDTPPFFKKFASQIKHIPPLKEYTVHPPGMISSEYYQEINHQVKNVIDNAPGYYSRQYKFAITDQEITVDFIFPYTEDEAKKSPNIVNLDKMFVEKLRRIHQWLFIANQYRNSECSHKLHIWLYLTHAPKLLDAEVVLGPHHANTAFTYPCRRESEIFIFREEEWFKVLIHETFHCYDLDFCRNVELSNLALTQIRAIFPRVSHTDVRVFETYCETMAETLNLLFYMATGDKENTVQEIIRMEQQFSVFQMVKVLRHMGLRYEDLFVAGKYREDTNIFAYYILKTICLLHLPEFLESHTESLRIEQTPAGINQFTQFIGEKARSPALLDIIQKMEKWWDKHPRGEKIEDLTLRMSLFG
jgi:hypothetical protein